MLLSVALSAQQKHFLYIQGENQQPFYLKMEGAIFSSSASGHIILPHLENGAVELTIGFPRAQWPEQVFRVDMKSADRGFILKNNTGKGWVLQDLQTLTMVDGQQVVSNKEALKEPEKKRTDDPFASSLADAINDPGIRDVDLVKNEAASKAPVVKKAPVVTPAPSPQIKKPVDSPAAIKPAIVEVKPVQADVKPTNPVPAASVAVAVQQPFVNEVKKLLEERNELSLNQVYLDRNGTSIDTIYLSFEVPVVVDSVSLLAEQLIKEDSVRLSKPTTIEKHETPTIEKAETPVSKPVATTTPQFEDKVVSAEKEKDIVVKPALPSRKDCKQVATEKDMIAARKKAYTQGSDAEVIALYMKEVKSRCYTVNLIQALSFAFVNDASRYQFFQEAYPWVYDPANYNQLERLFVSKEYIAKFRTLINAE